MDGRSNIPIFVKLVDFRRKSVSNAAHPVPIEGASAVVTDVGAGRGGRIVSQASGIDAYGESVWSRRPRVAVKFAMMLAHHAGDGDKQIQVARESTYKS